MPIRQFITLLPCHSLSDFPTHHRGLDADSLLASWTVLWHPQLVGMVKQFPQWRTAEDSATPQEGDLYLVPKVSSDLLPKDFAHSANQVGATVIEGSVDRVSLLRQLFQEINEDECKDEATNDLAADFFALGYAFLQVQLMTLQLRGSSNMDVDDFATTLINAATNWCERKLEDSRASLAGCFDCLLGEKNAYYPVQPQLIDLVLTAPTTVGNSFTNELAYDHPKSILLTSQLGRKLKHEQPENFSRLGKLVDNETVDIVGGLASELDDPLLSSETTVARFQMGLKWFRENLNADVCVFARRTFGLSSDLPAILDQLNFVGVLHATLAGGEIPVASTSHIRWESNDGASILALAQTAEDANEGFTFLRLSTWLGQLIDSAHVATVVLAHWPDRVHFCFNDLLRVRKYGNLFGSFISLTDFFDGIYDPGYGDTFSADEYQGSFLKSSLRNKSKNPVSRIVKYWRRTMRVRSLRAAATMELFANSSRDVDALTFNELDHLQAKIELASSSVEFDDDEIDSRVNEWEATFFSGQGDEFLVNTTNFNRTVFFRTENKNAFALSTDSPVRLAESESDSTNWIARVPPLSFTRLQGDSNVSDLNKEPLLCEENILRNEFFELMVDPQTGGIRSLDVYDRRKNLLSQRLAVRIPGQLDSHGRMTSARYAEMVCDDYTIKHNSRSIATIETSGRLVNAEGNIESTLAEYRQAFTVIRGIPIVEVEVEFTSVSEMNPNTNHYVCSRLAWKHDSTELVRNVRESRAFVSGENLEATNWIELRSPKNTVTLLTAGLPFHRRSSRRTLDTLLVVAGESERRFRFGIGLDISHPTQASIDFMTPPAIVNRKMKGNGGWLFDFNCKNIVATWMAPIFDQSQQLTGVEFRLRETKSRSGQLKIRCPRQLTTGRRVNFFGEHLREIETHENLATINFHGSEFFQIQLNWNT